MKRVLLSVLSAVTVAVALVGVRAASAHQCPDEYDPSDPACHETPVADDWRPNYVPLFDLADRDYGDPGSAEEERYEAQRWRRECRSYEADGSVEERQQCFWIYGGTSVREYGTDEGRSDDPEDTLLPRPNELHVGYAANHCFLAEGFHDCDRHGDSDEFATHDPHGGAVYADVCLSANPDSRYCDDGLEDNQVGVTIVDHLTCPMGCFDEYHLVRPLDPEYTQRQMEGSAEAIPGAASDPHRHLCGYEEQDPNC